MSLVATAVAFFVEDLVVGDIVVVVDELQRVVVVW